MMAALRRGVDAVSGRSLFLCWALWIASGSWAAAAEFDFQVPVSPSDPAATAVMRDLAERLLPVYQDTDPDRYLANLSALQMVAGSYAAAEVSRESLRDRNRRADQGRPTRAIIYDMYAEAKAVESEEHVAFAESFARSFNKVIPQLNDAQAYAVLSWLAATPGYREALQNAFDRQRSNSSIGESEAIQLIWLYLSFETYRDVGPLAASLGGEDERRRYSVDNEVRIETSNGATLFAMVVRPTTVSKPLPALLEFTIGDSLNYAKECAAHGYVGVVAYARGAQGSRSEFVPYRRDGDDARAVIDWITAQSWSDGRVGMYGTGYSGFTAWAAAKRLPPALKAIATFAPTAPGVNFPMGGGIFRNSAFRWSLLATDADAEAEPSTDWSLADTDPKETSRWTALDRSWYRSGRRYRDMGRIFGRPNRIFIRWLNHPSYDRYWQKMVPYQKQFADINIPVLTVTGYYATSEPGALYYFNQHIHYNPRANHTLIVGPYDDLMLKRGPAAILHGLKLDPAAIIDLRELRYRWFDSIFKDGPIPSLLKDHVNYEVMGTDQWRHAPAMDALGKDSKRFYLGSEPAEAGYRLVPDPPSTLHYLTQTVNLADRSDDGWKSATRLVTRAPEVHNGVLFMSKPFTSAADLSGLLSGHLDFRVNKMDLDLAVSLYERLATGDFIRLSNPGYEFRASYLRDRRHRHLIKAGEREVLTFRSERLIGRRLQAGSRLVVVLSINKRPDQEINYGAGKDVSAESIADGKIPLKVRWYNDSYIEIPIRP
jgi:putative CocE/NonD family hydrolase